MQQFADGGNEIVLHLVASRVDRGGQTGVGLVDGGGDPVQGLIQLGLHGVDGVGGELGALLLGVLGQRGQVFLGLLQVHARLSEGVLAEILSGVGGITDNAFEVLPFPHGLSSWLIGFA